MGEDQCRESIISCQIESFYGWSVTYHEVESLSLSVRKGQTGLLDRLASITWKDRSLA